MPTSHSSVSTYTEKQGEPDSTVIEARFFSWLPILLFAFSVFIITLRRASWYGLSDQAAMQQSVLAMLVSFIAYGLYVALRFMFRPHGVTINPGSMTIQYSKRTETIDLRRPMVFTWEQNRFHPILPRSTLHFKDATGANKRITIGSEFSHEYPALLGWFHRNFNETEVDVRLTDV